MANHLHHKRLLDFHFWKWISLNNNLTDSQMGEAEWHFFLPPPPHLCFAAMMGLNSILPYLIPYYNIYKPQINTHQMASFFSPKLHNPGIIVMHNKKSVKLEKQPQMNIFTSGPLVTRCSDAAQICCCSEMWLHT